MSHKRSTQKSQRKRPRKPKSNEKDSTSPIVIDGDDFSNDIATKRKHNKRPFKDKSNEKDSTQRSSPIVISDDDDIDTKGNPPFKEQQRFSPIVVDDDDDIDTKGNPPFKEQQRFSPIVVDDDDDFSTCPFCGESIPLPLPDRIQKYLIEINSSTRIKKKKKKISSSRDIRYNREQELSLSLLLQRSSGIVDQFEFCRLHDGEANTVPEGVKKNYPLVIDFIRLPERVEALIPKLMPIINGEAKSSFRDDVINAFQELGKARSRLPTYLIQRFETFQVNKYLLQFLICLI